MTIWRVFIPEYRGGIEIVKLKDWFLLEMIERQLHQNTEEKMTKTTIKKTKKRIFCLFCFMIKNCYNTDDIKKVSTPNQKLQRDCYFYLNMKI